MKVGILAAALALSAGVTGYSFGQITGKASLDGDAPEMAEIDAIKGVPDCAKLHTEPVYEESVVVGDNNELANVVVSIKPAEGQELGGDVPKEPAVIDQKGCTYHPHVLAVMKGQEILVKNDDAFMHNVQSQSKDNPPFNIAQQNKDPGTKIDPMKTAERFQVKCQVHPWMLAWVNVFDHPYFAVSKADGTFSIPAGLPDGTYTVTAWHESLGEKEEDVEVKDGKGEVNFEFAPESAQAEPVKENVKVAAAQPAGK